MEEMKKRFDEKFGYEISEMRKEYKSYLSKPEDITFFIQSEINLAVSKERERVVEEIKRTIKKSDTRSNQWWKDEGKREIINLINTK